MSNLRTKRSLKIVGVVAALAALGVASAVVFAQTEDTAAAVTVETSSFLAKVAANLGIEEPQLVAAMQTAHEQSIDEALAAGRITEEQATAMKERLATARAMAELIDEAVASGRITQSQADQMNRGSRAAGMMNGMGEMRGSEMRGSMSRGGSMRGAMGCSDCESSTCGRGMSRGFQP
ncbi:MAG: hypothetical protein AB1778_00295 [Candidatus Bipolaricaulota bacterium]